MVSLKYARPLYSLQKAHGYLLLAEYTPPDPMTLQIAADNLFKREKWGLRPVRKQASHA